MAANPFACGTGSCSAVNGVAAVMCTPDPGGGICLDANGNIALASSIAELLTLSNAGPLKFSADASAGSTGVLFTSAAASPTVGLLGISGSSTTNCNDGISPNNMLLVLAGSNSAHNFQVTCGGSVKANNNLTVAGTTIVAGATQSNGGLVLGGGTGAGTGGAVPQLVCGLTTTTCEFDFNSTSNPAQIWKANGGAGMGGTNSNFEWWGSNSPVQLLKLNGQGDLIDPIGNIRAISTANATGEVESGNAVAVTGAKGIGAMVAGGMLYSGTVCSIANGTTSAGTPTSTLTTLTTGQTRCKITSGSTTGTIFNISVPGAVTLTNAADCQFTASTVAEPQVTSTTTLCILTYAVAPGTVLLGQLDINGNGP